MGQFDSWAGRQIRKSQKAKKFQEARGIRNVNSKQWPSSAIWAAKNPDLAKYDNDGKPVDPSHWA